MKYIVTRTSAFSDEKPIENAHLEKVHYFEYYYKDVEKNKPDAWNKFKRKNHDIHIDENGHWRGTNNVPIDTFVSDVEDLHKFVEQYGKIVLMKPDNAEGLWTIEIYDRYRE